MSVCVFWEERRKREKREIKIFYFIIKLAKLREQKKIQKNL